MEIMTEIACGIGGVFMFGGASFIVAVIAVAAWDFLGTLWIDASNKWRNICKAESLIYEYRREREKYLAWTERTVTHDKS